MSYHVLLRGLWTNLYHRDMRCNDVITIFYPSLIKASWRMTIHKGVILHEAADKGK